MVGRCEDASHFVVFEPREQLVTPSDGGEPGRFEQADDVIGEGGNRDQRRRRRDRYRHDDALRSTGPAEPDRGLHRRAGSQAIVNKHDRPTAQFERGARAPIAALAALYLGSFPGRDAFELRLGIGDESHDVRQPRLDPPRGDGTHGELRLVGNPHFAHDENVEFDS